MKSKHREHAVDRLRELIAEVTGTFPSTDYCWPVIDSLMDAAKEESTERIMESERRSSVRMRALTSEVGGGFSNDQEVA